MPARLIALALAAGLALLTVACGEGAPDSAARSAEAPDAGAQPVGSPEAGSALLDPNGASREEILALPGVDDALADALIAARPYADMLEVDAVLAAALGTEDRERIYGRLFKPLDLNGASEEEILLIPGVGSRMAHEFEEYRPYRGIEEFRREIGKYVDEAEVRRLERYVTLR